MLECSEVDPEYHLYPVERPRVTPKDEIEMKSSKKTAMDATLTKYASKSPPLISPVNASMTVSGAFVNSTQVPTLDLLGNFGVRVIESMPTDIREVYV
jgi:hypothetical protein